MTSTGCFSTSVFVIVLSSFFAFAKKLWIRCDGRLKEEQLLFGLCVSQEEGVPAFIASADAHSHFSCVCQTHVPAHA